MSFRGFDPDAIAVLSELPTWDSDRYAERAPWLKTGVSEPGWALIQEVAEVLPVDLTVARRSSVSPLHADMRFAKAGAPRYKDHLLLTAWHGDDKRTGATLWLRIDAERVGLASGIALAGPARDRWREAVADDRGAALATRLERLTADSAVALDVAGDQLARVPAPYPSDHPRADLLRRKSFQVRTVAALPASMSAEDFAPWCARQLDALLPIHHWLVDHVEDS